MLIHQDVGLECSTFLTTIWARVTHARGHELEPRLVQMTCGQSNPIRPELTGSGRKAGVSVRHGTHTIHDVSITISTI